MGGSRKSVPGVGQGQGAGKGGASRHERRRREPRQTRRRRRRGGRVLGGGVPLPNGEESGEGAVPPPQKIFEFLISNWRIFMDYESIT